ncbi:DMP19 family protein [Stieleria sp. JC731]|uniref:DMP19 family protein n=1 Tax=Pirellulaceae TaxID=2691357 RepID=UPI001E49D7E5|nr:DUF4375 domain-containing protein [Stieleria sp. JC731]MCC9603730.1 DMP19 family protein [Stieleria sp. JC731]
MQLTSDSVGVEYSEQGEVLFACRWDDIQRVSAWRNIDPEYDRYYVSVEIVPDRKLEMLPWMIYLVPELGPDEEWQLWTAALSKNIPGFSVDAAMKVLELSEDSDGNSIPIMVRDFQDSIDDPASEDELWFDEYFEANAAALVKPQIADPKNRVFATTYNLLAEVQNGGFDQYFGNSTGDELKLVRESLQLIEAFDLLEILDSACSTFPRGMPGKSQETRVRQLERMSSKKRRNLDELGDQVSNLAEETIRRLRAFIEAA